MDVWICCALSIGKIIIPQAVFDEIVLAGAGKPGASEVREISWIEIRRTTNQLAVRSLQLELDAGDAEAMALAAELKADLLLLDERKGRVGAERLGLRFVGLLGVLAEAKQRGLILTIRPIMDDLRRVAGFWISPKLYEHILQVVGE